MEAVVAEAEAEFLEMLKGQSADGTFNTLVSEPARPTPTPSFSLEQVQTTSVIHRRSDVTHQMSDVTHRMSDVMLHAD